MIEMTTSAIVNCLIRKFPFSSMHLGVQDMHGTIAYLIRMKLRTQNFKANLITYYTEL